MTKIKNMIYPLLIKGRYDTVSVPLSIEISKNIAPDFSVNCSNSCSVAENSSQGATIIRANRIDNDSDSVSYQLQNTFSEKFEINDQTGEVKLKNTLDYEDSTSYDLTVNRFLLPKKSLNF